MDLRDLQESFQRIVFRESAGTSPALLRPQNVEVYIEAYAARIRSILASTFPMTKRSLGSDRFNALTGQFLDSFRSTSFDASDACLSFPEFVERHSFSKEVPILPELASLELDLEKCFHAPSLDGIDRRDFETIVESDGMFRVQPYVRLRNFEKPILTVWMWARAESSSEEISNMPIREYCEKALIYRQNFKVKAEHISELELAVFRNLQQGRSAFDAVPYAPGIPATELKGLQMEALEKAYSLGLLASSF